MTDECEWDAELAEAARGAMGHAYAPYSRFAVGAAVRLADGRIITGANFENASYGLSLCAETVAIAATNAAGDLSNVRAIALIGGPMEPPAQEDPSPITPCGRCRQVIAEAAMLAGRDIKVYCASLSGTQQAVYTISELLPHAFSAADFSA
ncbi:MAG: cytidine deaminase [Sphingobium sp.]|nr:cytidine deaminase [Sphingobium sp.]